MTPRFDRLRSDAYCPSQCSCKLSFLNDDTLLAKMESPANPFGNFEASRSKALSSSDSHLTQNFSEHRNFQRDLSIISRPFSSTSNKERIQISHCPPPTDAACKSHIPSSPSTNSTTPGSRVNLLLNYGRKYIKKEPRILQQVQKDDNSESTAHKAAQQKPPKQRRKITFIKNKIFPQTAAKTEEE